MWGRWEGQETGAVLGRRVVMPPNDCFKGLCRLMTAKILRRKQTCEKDIKIKKDRKSLRTLWC